MSRKKKTLLQKAAQTNNSAKAWQCKKMKNQNTKAFFTTKQQPQFATAKDPDPVEDSEFELWYLPICKQNKTTTAESRAKKIMKNIKFTQSGLADR